MTRNILPKSDEMKTITLTYQTNAQFNVSNKSFQINSNSNNNN